VERFNFKKLNKVEGTKKYLVKILNRFIALENLDDDMNISRACGTIGESINISAKESYYKQKEHKPWFDEGRSKLLDQRKEAKLCTLYSNMI
jgi:hypothetical protein